MTELETNLVAEIDRREGDAAQLDRLGPVLESRVVVGATIAKRVVDTLETVVRDSDGPRREWLTGLELEPGVVEKILPHLRARELALVEIFSDRVLDFVDEARTASAAAGARANALREGAAALRALLPQKPEDDSPAL